MKNIQPAFLFLFLISCTYEPEGEMFKDVKKVENPETAISLNNHDNSSTIYLFEQREFSYYIASASYLERVEVLMDGTLINSSQSSSGYFYIPESLMSNGKHQLKIQFQGDSGSGSLANKLGLEKLQVWRSWEIVIELTKPPKPNLVVSEEDGHLKLTWEPYNKLNFTYYMVSVWGTFGGQNFYIDDPNQASFIDMDYVGGYIKNYMVTVITPMHYVDSDVTQVNDEVHLSGEYDLSDSTISLRWDKADFIGCFASYTVFENGIELPIITAVSDTILKLKREPIFGLPKISYGVRVDANDYSHSPISNFDEFTTYPETSRLYPRPHFFSYNATLHSIFSSFGGNEITQYDDDFISQQTIPIYSNYIVPYLGPSIYQTEPNHGIAQMNLQTNETKYVDILPLTTWGYFSSPLIFSASSNQIVSFSYRAHNTSGTQLVTHVQVYDMINHISLFHQESTNDVFVVSSSGKYVSNISTGQMYHINGATLESLNFNFPGGGRHYFRPDNDEESFVVNFTSKQIDFFDTYTGALKRTYAYPDNSYDFSGYDPTTKNFFFAGNNRNQVYWLNADTGEVTTTKSYAQFGYEYKIVNGYLINPDGYYLKAIPN